MCIILCFVHYMSFISSAAAAKEAADAAATDAAAKKASSVPQFFKLPPKIKEVTLLTEWHSFSQTAAEEAARASAAAAEEAAAKEVGASS